MLVRQALVESFHLWQSEPRHVRGERRSDAPTYVDYDIEVTICEGDHHGAGATNYAVGHRVGSGVTCVLT